MAQQRGRRGGSRDAGPRDARSDDREQRRDRQTRTERDDGPRARPGQPSAEHRERLRAVVGPVVAEAGYDLEDLTVSRVGRRHLLRIAVDSDHGVDLDAVAEVARLISGALDAAEATGDELIAGEYELEVGSPGVDRSLTEPRHWRRNVRRLVRVRAAGQEVTGRIVTADAEGVTLDVDGTQRVHAYGELGPGRVQVELKRLDELPELDEDEDDLDLDGDEEDESVDDDEEGEDEA